MLDLLPNFPKIEAPFIRKTYKIEYSDWKKYGSELQLRKPEVYLITEEVNKNCEWVFDDGTYAVEKLNGTNVAVEVRGGRLTKVQNRLNNVDFTKVVGKADGLPQNARFLEGILNASDRNYLEDDKLQYGELVGPRFNGNDYKLDKHMFYPFDLAKERLRYKSFNKYPKEFWGWCRWFETALYSLFYQRINKISKNNTIDSPIPYAEGVVIYSCDGNRMSKLRRDMYPWHYWDKIHIKGLEKQWLEYAQSNGLTVRGY